MSEEREDTRDLDCPQCGAGVPALRWHEPDEEWPEGEFLAWLDEEHVCPECGALCQVGLDGDQAYLTLVHCRHGHPEDECCWRCDLRAWISSTRCRIRRWLLELWCGLRIGHRWERVQWVPGREHEYCPRCGGSRPVKP